MGNPTGFSWTDPVTNTDGSAITAGEVTGYTVGVRSTTAAGSVAGTYLITGSVAGAASTGETVAALSALLKPDTYAAAVRADGPVPSAWSTEATFTIAPAQPNPPSGFVVS
jgi:hypothetical protein